MNYRCLLTPETEKLILAIAKKQKIAVNKYGPDYAWINWVDEKFDRIDLNNIGSAPDTKYANFVSIDEFLGMITKKEKKATAIQKVVQEKGIRYNKAKGGFYRWGNQVILISMKGNGTFDEKDNIIVIRNNPLVYPIRIQ